MWSAADSPERIAQQFIASLFGVPQVSVRLAELSTEHLDVARHWLAFWRQHADLLLHSRAARDGRRARLRRGGGLAEGVAVTVRYGDGPITRPDDGCREWHVVNGAEADVVVIGLDGWTAVRFEIRDARGRLVDEGRRAFGGVEIVPVPAGGRLAVWELA